MQGQNARDKDDECERRRCCAMTSAKPHIVSVFTSIASSSGKADESTHGRILEYMEVKSKENKPPKKNHQK